LPGSTPAIASRYSRPAQASIKHSDTQIGLLQGFSFTMCYATAGVFIACLVDRANRVRLIAVCIAIWAISTALCGFATNFGELLLARATRRDVQGGMGYRSQRSDI